MLNRPTFDITHSGHTFHCAGDRNFDLDRPMVCVTGARRATPYGLALAEESGRILADTGHTLLTTAAMGCSVAAARAALDAGGEVVVMSATGCNNPYPATSRDVFERANLVMSLGGPDAPATIIAFRARDSVIPDLVDSLVLCESGLRSGSLALADDVLELGKSVFVYPGSVFSPTSEGCNGIIAHGGATMLTSTIHLANKLDRMSSRVTDVVRENDPFLAALVATPMRADDLARSLDAQPLDVLRKLAAYEVDGKVQRLPDGRYAFVPRR